MNIMAALGLDFAGTVQIDETNLIRYNTINQISLEGTLRPYVPCFWSSEGIEKSGADGLIRVRGSGPSTKRF